MASGARSKTSRNRKGTVSTSDIDKQGDTPSSNGVNTISPSQSLSYPCGSCNQAVLDSDLGIECELRKYWFHCTCQDVPKKLYETLNTCKQP